MTDLISVNNWLWIRREPGAEKIGSIVVPDRHQEVSEVATVVFCDEQSEFRPGQKIVLAKVAGTRITVGDEDLWVVRPDEVVGVFPELCHLLSREHDWGEWVESNRKHLKRWRNCQRCGWEEAIVKSLGAM